MISDEKFDFATKLSTVGMLIDVISRLQTNLLDRNLLSLGLTYQQAVLMMTIPEDAAEGPTQSVLAAAMDVGNSTVVGLLDRLEAKGFIRRTLSAANRRVKHILLTQKGRDARVPIRAKLSEIDDQAFAACDPDVMKFLKRAKGRLQAIDTSANRRIRKASSDRPVRFPSATRPSARTCGPARQP